MSIEICFVAVGILLLFSVFDLIVGVSNDAVNFLNSSIGSKVAPYTVIIIVASLGILAGVLFSGGMMEVARKGIFHPQFFTMPELIAIFMAVMLADVILLDLFNTYGIPTSTTVSIVFELLGAAVAVALIKILLSDADISKIADYINTAKAMTIVFGILLSVIVSFIAGSIVQFFARLAFTFDYKSKISTWGGLWGGLSIAIVTLFILIKGAKHAAFLSSDDARWIAENSWLLLLGVTVVTGCFFQLLVSVFKFNVLKPIVLIGTFALALAFAANDLVNFIGVPMAGYHSYIAANATAAPLTTPMVALQGQVPTNTWLLLLAGGIMVASLCLSKKARTVTDTSVDLSRQEEDGGERFESAALARVIVRMVAAFFERSRALVPRSVRKLVRTRMKPHEFSQHSSEQEEPPSFDLVRASVNLIVASAVVSLATSMKLPLSTTYVTFMVAMGTSFSDQAWGRETAVYRVTGVLTVVGCWFLTAIFAFTLAFLFAAALIYFKVFGAILLLLAVSASIWRTHRKHSDSNEEKQQEEVFNLKKVKNASQALQLSFEHAGLLIREIRSNLDMTLSGLFEQNLEVLRRQRRDNRKIAKWTSIVTANVFKVLRLLSREQAAACPDFSRTNRCLQNISEAYRDTVVRAYEHTRNHHKPLLSIQVSELSNMKKEVLNLLADVESAISGETPLDEGKAQSQLEKIFELIEEYNTQQAERIRNRSSKTRLTILFLSILGDLERFARQSVRLLEIYHQAAEVDDIIASQSAKQVKSIFQKQRNKGSVS